MMIAKYNRLDGMGVNAIRDKAFFYHVVNDPVAVRTGARSFVYVSCHRN